MKAKTMPILLIYLMSYAPSQSGAAENEENSLEHDSSTQLKSINLNNENDKPFTNNNSPLPSDGITSLKPKINKTLPYKRHRKSSGSPRQKSISPRSNSESPRMIEILPSNPSPQNEEKRPAESERAAFEIIKKPSEQPGWSKYLLVESPEFLDEESSGRDGAISPMRERKTTK